jgi:hypothetical protein
MWRWSGLGWTVIPCAPNCWQSFATSIKFGVFPPLAFLMVATLLIFTLNLTIQRCLYKTVKVKNLLRLQ